MTDVENDVGAHDEMSPEEVRIQMEAEAMIEAEEEERIRNRTFIEKLQYRCMPMYGCELMGHKFHITEVSILISLPCLPGVLSSMVLHLSFVANFNIRPIFIWHSYFPTLSFLLYRSFVFFPSVLHCLDVT